MTGTFRFLFRTSARPGLTLLGLLVTTVGSRASQHEVTIYSYFTEAGKAMPARPSDDFVRCRLFSAGYEEVGEVRSSPPSRPPSADLVIGVLTDALRVNGFHCGETDEDVALALVCQWGYTDPPRADAFETGRYSWHERLKILTLVGGPVLSKVDSTERALILEAAREERYFVVLSAYDFKSYVPQKSPQLLWRTQISVPASGLSHERAAPLMITVAASLFGRETPAPRRILVNVVGTLRPVFKIR